MVRVALISGLLAALAVAGEKLTLTFVGGKKKTVTVLSFDEEGITLVSGGKERKAAWIELKPESAYEARKALTPYDDGKGRLALARFARSLRLYAGAQEQLEIALALAGLTEEQFETEAKEIEAEEVAFLCARIDTLLKTGEHPTICLKAIKRLKERYPDHENNTRYEPHIKALVEKLAQEIEAKQAAQKKKVDDAELSGLRKALEKLDKKKLAALEKAKKLHDESAEAIEKRQISRVKNKLVEPRGAERYYKQARKYLRAQAKADRGFRIITKADLQKEYEAIETKLIDCYLKVARILLTQRNYKGAVKYVRNALYYDPINEDALDMKKTIEENRISFRMSDITYTRPRVTGG